MIRDFRDHAANERTFLAWARTAIAVMAFGFLIERFDLLLKAVGLSSHVPAPQGYNFGSIAGVSSLRSSGSPRPREILTVTMNVRALARIPCGAREPF
jgi:hypothetical protein